MFPFEVGYLPKAYGKQHDIMNVSGSVSQGENFGIVRLTNNLRAIGWVLTLLSLAEGFFRCKQKEFRI